MRPSQRRLVWVIMLTAFSPGGGAVYGHQGTPPAADSPEPMPDFYYDPPTYEVPGKLLEHPLWYEAAVCVAEDLVWYAWLEFTPQQGDRVWVGSRVGDAWRTQFLAVPDYGEYANPTLTMDSAGRLWLSFEARQGNQWDVFTGLVADGQSIATPRKISASSGSDIHHRVAADPHGGLWFVWQSDRDGEFEIVARPVAADRVGDLTQFDSQQGGAWHPGVAVDEQGCVYVAWDAYDGNAFNVRLRVYRDCHWSPPLAVTDSAAFDGRVDIVARPGGGCYVAWETGGENWGKSFRGIKTPTVRDQHGPLHRYRHLEVAAVAQDGRLQRLTEPFPMPSVTAAAARSGIALDRRRLGAFYERPRIVVDSRDRLWVFYRHFYTPWLGIEHRSHVEEGWRIYARHQTGDGWSPLYRLETGQGDGMQRMDVAAGKERVHAVWTTGRTHRTASPLPRGLVTAAVTTQLDPGGRFGNPVAIPAAESDIAEPAAAPHKRGAAIQVGELECQLFFGDLHRHTDLSLCRVPLDGTIDDAYRYATEVARLDFLGITDHTRDIAQGNPLSQLWWRCRKEVLRHQLGPPASATFLPFYSYERSHGNTADHNVISLRPDMLRPFTYPVPEFWKELDSDTITIPHQPIRRDTWAYQDDKLRPLVEIFQGCRDNSIEADVHQGLALGYRLGFIASSDHMSTSASYACVWAEQASRASIFRALQARRTYAATDRMRLLVTAGEHWMGEAFSADSMPELRLEAHGTAPIGTVNLVQDGIVIESLTPSERVIELRRRPQVTGSHYFYFHLVQEDGNEAWSSPIWVDVRR